MVKVEKSERKDKKLKALYKGKWIHFGQTGYQHFKDKTGLLDKSLSHGDEKRRQRYLKRAKGIKNKSGELTWKDPSSANYYAVRYLWSA